MSAFSEFGNWLFGVPSVSSAPYTQDAQADQDLFKQYAGREQSDYNNESALGANLWKTVNGTGGPSVAQTQLQQTLGQNLDNGLAMGSGASGANSVLARYLAAQQTGNSADAIAQSAAMLRAKEVQGAQQQLGGLYSNMDASSAGMAGTSGNLGLGYSGLANSVDQANAQRQQQAEAAGLQFVSGLGSMYFGKPPGGIGGGASASTFSPGGNNTAFWSNPTNNAYRSAFSASAGA
jgi:hypothetical protein